MSQIDKAFLSAYAKKRPSGPSAPEVRPIVDPTGERLLKIHLSSSYVESLQPHMVANVIPPSVTPKPLDKNIEPPPRKTLTSYLQQARQTSAQPVVSTRWSSNTPTSQSAPSPQSASSRPLAKEDVPKTQPLPTAPIQQYRVDTPHTENPPIYRAESTSPWFFGTVERGIKATADSKSVSARTFNESKRTVPNVDIEAQTQIDSASRLEKNRVENAAPVNESQRRAAPLGKSLDAEKLAKLTLPIQPLWEVDEFLWPNVTANLLVTQAEAFHEIGLHLQHAQSKGLRVLSITSGERGVGRSTTAMCLAKTMSKLGLKIGLIDGDYECPGLVDQLSLETQYGWQQCLLENIPLDEVAIHSVNEAITLFPLTDSIAISQVAIHTIRINKLIKRIANAYDMVIIDANRVTQKQCQLLGTGDDAVLDAALLIVDAELSLRQRVDSAIELVRQQGVQSIGLAENFHS